MIRQHVMTRSNEDGAGFRLRSLEVSRLEGLSDAVFGFAVTLLVVSLEVPQTFDQLMALMSGFISFALSFAILILIWYDHYTFFRRYGLEDGWIITLNSALLFVVLFYIYPLKFMFSAIVVRMTGLGRSTGVVPFTWEQGPMLMMIYSLSIFVVFLLLFLMYLHAYRRRDALALDPLEVHMTRASLQSHGIWMVVALLSILLAWRGGPRLTPFAGLLYCLLGPLQGWNGAVMGKRGLALKAAREQAPAAA